MSLKTGMLLGYIKIFAGLRSLKQEFFDKMAVPSYLEFAPRIFKKSGVLPHYLGFFYH